MKILKTSSYSKITKSKYPKEETTPYNPWAVCSDNIDKEKEPEKHERCVQHIKDKNREKNR